MYKGELPVSLENYPDSPALVGDMIYLPWILLPLVDYIREILEIAKLCTGLRHY